MKQVMTLMLTVAMAGLIAAPVAAAQSRQAATFKLTETRPGVQPASASPSIT